MVNRFVVSRQGTYTVGRILGPIGTVEVTGGCYYGTISYFSENDSCELSIFLFV